MPIAFKAKGVAATTLPEFAPFARPGSNIVTMTADVRD